MKQLQLVFFLFILISFESSAQRLNWESVCQSDTLVLQRYPEKNHRFIDSAQSYQAFKCSKVSDLGWRFDIGFSRYFYNAPTKAWLGNHGGPSFGLVFAFRHWNLGVRFKPWTLNPKQELSFNARTLPVTARLNPVKFDYFLGYSFDFKHNFSLEPYVGFSRSVFEVINEDELKETYSIPRSMGLISGFSFNQYLCLSEANFVSLFVNVGYSFVDFRKTHQSLGTGYSEVTLGLAYKAFNKKQFYKALD